MICVPRRLILYSSTTHFSFNMLFRRASASAIFAVVPMLHGWMQCSEFDDMREITKAMRCEFEEDLIHPKKAKNMNDFAHLEVGGNGLKLGYLASTRRWGYSNEWINSTLMRCAATTG